MVNYHNYFNKYSKVSKSNINDVLKILNKFKKYLDTIYLNISEFKPNTNYDTIIETLKTYMNIIYNYYDKIQISQLENNININYHFIDVMTIAIIILYSYIFFNNNKTKIIKNKKDTTFKFIMHKILIKYYAAISSPITIKTLYKFKNIIYTNKPKPNQKKYIIDFINKISKFNKIKPSNKRYFTIPQYTGICWFISFIVGICYSDKNKELLIKKFNFNKKNYKKDETIANLSAKQIFTTLIYRIIKEITEVHKRYDEIDEKTINELNIYLKETPIKFLIKLMNEYYYNPNKDDYSKEYNFIKDYINQKQYDLTKKYFIKKIKIINQKFKEKGSNNDIINDIIRLKEIYPYDYYYFNDLFNNYIKLYNFYVKNDKTKINLFDKEIPISIDKFKKITGVNYKPLTINNFLKLGNVGLHRYNNLFLKVLYKFLNIDSLYLIKTYNKFYTYENNDTIPDIILIDIDNDYYIIDNIKAAMLKEIVDKITYESTDIISYKGHKYAIDYILNFSDVDNSWKKAGHVNVVLNYNNEEYFYDSSYSIKKYIHKNKTLRYSCPLLKKEWKKDFVYKKTKFCIKKCFHTNLNDKSKLFNDFKNAANENICYSSNNKNICCYVKVI